MEKGFAQRRNLDKEMARDTVAASTLDAAMQMERLRASHEANQAKDKELSFLEAAVVAFRKGVGQRLGALDLCPTAGHYLSLILHMFQYSLYHFLLHV